jgi:hypothetical protein
MNPEMWDRLRQARDRLAGQILDHPDVSMVDIGYDTQPEAGQAERQVVLRVHLRGLAAANDLNLPAEVDGIPVRVITAQYGLE